MKNDSQKVSLTNIPKHIAIIMDGSRRWDKKMSYKDYRGHSKGVDVLQDITRHAGSLGVEVLTVYAFSTENWTRPENEVSTLLNLFEKSLIKQKKTMIETGVRLNTIGDLSSFPLSLQQAIKNIIDETKEGKGIDLVLALNYGARDEILRAAKKMFLECQNDKVFIDNISEERFSSFLDTSNWPDPDLIIRTSGEKRLSNFLLWQASYAELLFLDVLWPDFTKDHFDQALVEYQNRNRRLGGR